MTPARIPCPCQVSASRGRVSQNVAGRDFDQHVCSNRKQHELTRKTLAEHTDILPFLPSLLPLRNHGVLPSGSSHRSSANTTARISRETIVTSHEVAFTFTLYTAILDLTAAERPDSESFKRTTQYYSISSSILTWEDARKQRRSHAFRTTASTKAP